MRVSLAGLGGAALRGHLPAIARAQADSEVRVVAAADPDEARRALVGSCGFPVFNTTQAMLEAVPSDLLVVAVDSSAHARLTMLGARYRRHVLCEKPLALTRAEHDLVAATTAAEPDLGVVPVHQYRYSPAWSALAAAARVANRMRKPFKLVARVEREQLDSHAASPWRADPIRSGGILADHGPHFLALAWTVDARLDVIDVRRRRGNDGRESACARVRVGSGFLELRLSSAASKRTTAVELRVAGIRHRWQDDAYEVFAGKRVIRRRAVAAISDRAHVDALYVPLYRETIQNLGDHRWRARRTAEALTVSGALVQALEAATL